MSLFSGTETRLALDYFHGNETDGDDGNDDPLMRFRFAPHPFLTTRNTERKQTTMTNLTSTARTHGNLVAGASAEGYGVLVGWAGAGEMTRARLVDIAGSVPGVDPAWLPSAKDPGVQLTIAVRAACGVGYSAERVAKSTWSAETEPREWSSRWLLVSRQIDGAAVAGASFGTVVLVATLYLTDAGHDLVINTESDGLAETVRATFEERIGAERYQAAHVTAWLSNVMRNHLLGVKLGGGWYLPRASRATGEALCEAFKKSGWGRSWFSPALPIATSAQLSLGVANGLSDEAGEIGEEIRQARRDAIEANRLNVGERAGKTFHVRLLCVGARIAQYAAVIGEDGLRLCHAAFCDALIELDGVVDGLNPATEWDRFDFGTAEAA